MNKRGLLLIAALMAVVGGIWFGQGMGWISGSVMTNDTRWSVIGGLMGGVAGALIWFALTRKSPKG